MSETFANEARRPVGHGLVASPLPPSLSLPRPGDRNTLTHPPVPSNVAKCGSFFERHPDAVPHRATTLSKADLFAASRLYPMDAAPSSASPSRGRDAEGRAPHGTEPAIAPTHDHVIGAATAKPAPDLLAVARIHPAGAARA